MAKKPDPSAPPVDRPVRGEGPARAQSDAQATPDTKGPDTKGPGAKGSGAKGPDATGYVKNAVVRAREK